MIQMTQEFHFESRVQTSVKTSQKTNFNRVCVCACAKGKVDLRARMCEVSYRQMLFQARRLLIRRIAGFTLFPPGTFLSHTHTRMREIS